MGTAQTRRFAPAPPAAELVDRALQCIAGVYEDEATARQAMQLLRSDHHLTSSQMQLMGPQDASPARFAWRSRQWTGRWPSEGRQRMGEVAVGALLGALFAGILAMLWLVLEIGTPAAGSENWWLQLWWTVAAMVGGAVIAAIGTAVADGTRRPRQFDANVRRQLRAGRWAVVAHCVHIDRQAGVLALLRASGRHWSAAAKPMQRV
jgi:hypothetical protein